MIGSKIIAEDFEEREICFTISKVKRIRRNGRDDRGETEVNVKSASCFDKDA